MNIIQAGTGETIIFIHGLVGNHRVFRNQLSYFSKKYHVVTYDYLGHGENKSNDVSFTLDNLVEELNNIYETARIEKAHICSLSFGCYIASCFASKYPVKVLSLCQIGGSYNNPSRLLDSFSLLWQNKDMEYKSWVKLFGENIIPSDPNTPDSVIIKSRNIFYENAIKMDSAIMKEVVRLRIFYDMKNTIKKIFHPILWVMGEYDYFYKTCLYDLFELVPQVQYVELPMSGHVAHVFQPEIFQNNYKFFLQNTTVDIT